MNPQAIIDELMVEEGLDPTDGDNAAAIVRDMLALNQINSYIHLYAEWEWTYIDGDITFGPAANSASLPTDYMSLGMQGGLFDEQGKDVYEVSKWRMRRARAANSTDLSHFAIWSGQVHVAPAITGGATWGIYYRTRPELLVYDDTEMLLPDRYKDLVVVPGLRMKLKKNKSDGRDWNSEFKAGLALMKGEENPMRSRTRGVIAPVLPGRLGA